MICKKGLHFSADWIILIPMEAISQGDVAVKRYPFKFSVIMLILFIIGLLLSLSGFGITLWRFLDFLKGEDINSVYTWIQYVLLFFVSVFLAAIIVAMLIRSQYVITGTHLILQFGFIKQKHAISTIFSVHLFKGLNKLAVYFDDYKTNYIVIVVKETWYDDFIKTLIERKPSIAFTFSTPEEEADAKKK